MIFCRIQHHPSRADLLPELLSLLDPLPVEVITHSSDPPNPWEGYKQCLTDIPMCSHLLIVQDDTIPCLNFPSALEKVAERNPSTPVCLFMGSMPASTAAVARRSMMKNRRYVPLLAAPFVPLVCVLWPRLKAQKFLDWSKDERRITRADDGNAARFMRTTKQPFLVTIPSLVEHNDYVPSVKGGRTHKPGAESWRRALFLAEDGLNYEW